MAAMLWALVLGACSAPSQLGQDGRARIVGRTFVITGASSGLGRGAALKLAAYGANVVLAARRTVVLDQVAREAQAAIGRFDAVPVEDHARVVDVNLKGYIYGTHAALRQFHRQGFGTLVNVSSVEAHVPLAYEASYAATKAAITALDTALNQELRLMGADGIKIVTVEPWGVDTPFYEHAANYTGRATRMSEIEGPWESVDAIVWAVIHPFRGEYPVGWRAAGGLVGAQIWPELAAPSAQT